MTTTTPGAPPSPSPPATAGDATGIELDARNTELCLARGAAVAGAGGPNPITIHHKEHQP